MIPRKLAAMMVLWVMVMLAVFTIPITANTKPGQCPHAVAASKGVRAQTDAIAQTMPHQKPILEQHAKTHEISASAACVPTAP